MEQPTTTDVPNPTAGMPADGFRAAQWRMLLATMFCYLFYYTGRQNFGWAIPGIQQQLGIAEDMVGWFGTAVLWTYALGQAINGNLGDKFGGRRMVSLGAIGSCGLNWVTSFGQSFWTLLIPWGLNGYVQSFAWAPGSRVLANWWPRHEHGRAFGLYTFAAGFSSVLTYGLCILVLRYASWVWLFRLPVLLLLVGGILYYLVVRDRPEDLGYPPLSDASDSAATGPAESSLERYRHVFGNFPFLAACVSMGFQSAARYGLLFWIPSHCLGLSCGNGFGTAWIALALPIGMAAGAVVGGQVSDRLFHSNRTNPILLFLAAGAVVSAVAYLVPVEHRLASLALLFIAGFCIYAPQASFWPLCPEMLGLHRAGTGVGIMDTFAYVFAGLAQPLIGWTIKASGQTATAFLVVAGCSLIGAICILGARPRGVDSESH
jgi:MFS transporter, OPA family, glycerol-3-phosphate transporter